MAEKTQIGKFRIISKVGEGGMGTVYKAVHPTLKKHVIIKQLRISGKKTITQRFRREADLMISFRHENIVPVYDHFREGSSYYIVMEFIDGLSLEDLLEKKGALNPIAASLIFCEVAKGLKYAHDKGVVHRDIKPDNVLISKNGEVRLVDFGIATSAEGSEEELTSTGMVMGTPAYMSPEQISDSKSVDNRSDIYSMAVMFYRMLTGKKPFPGNFTAESIAKITRGQYEKPTKLNADIPRLLNVIIKKAMHHKKEKRYKDMDRIIQKLQKYLRRFRTQSVINQSIRDYITGSDQVHSIFSLEARKKRKKRILIVAAILGGAISIAAGIFFFMRSPLPYEFFLGHDYGLLMIEAALPEDYYKSEDAIYAYSYIKRDDKLEEDEKGQWTEALISRKKEIDTKSRVLSSRPMYLEAGNYTIFLNLENKKYCQTFYLNPRVLQKKRLETEKGHVVRFDLPSVKHPVDFNFFIFDERNGRKLNDSATVLFRLSSSETRLRRYKYLNWRNYWRYQTSWMKKKLLSSRFYDFQISVPGYFAEKIHFFVEPDRDSVRIESRLIPIPGTLLLNCNHQGLGIKVDNQDSIYTFTSWKSREREFINFGHTLKGNKKILMPEGKYVLTIDNNTNHTFYVNSGKLSRVTVYYDEKSRKITIK